MNNTGHPFYTATVFDPGTLVDAGIFPSLQVMTEMMEAVCTEAVVNQGIPHELSDYLQAGLQELARLRDSYRPVIEGEVL